MEALTTLDIPLFDKNEILEGIVRLVQYDILLNDYVAWLEYGGYKVIIPRSELELYEIKGNLNQYIGGILSFNIIEFDEKRQIFLASCKSIKEKKRNRVIERLNAGEVFDGKIVKIVYFGAYLQIEDISVILRNQDFANDYTTIADIYQEGDTIKVKLLKINDNLKINVQAVVKYESQSTISIEDFEPQTVVYGLVRNVKSWACFVNIAPNLDAICPVPTYLNIKEGMKVAFRINQVRLEEGRVRGKIVKVIH